MLNINMSKKETIGTFVFRNDGDNCLSSKYFHGNQPHPFVETAKRLPDDDTGQTDGFSGNYETTWIQENRQHVSAELSIHWLPNNTYSLTWVDVNGHTHFNGIGII